MSEVRGRSLITILSVLFCLLLLLVFCAFVINFDWGHSAGGTTPKGRSVMFYSDSWRLTTGQTGDTWTAKIGGRTVVVAPRNVTVDGREFAQLEPNTMDVSVTSRRGQITIVADGVTIAAQVAP